MIQPAIVNEAELDANIRANSQGFKGIYTSKSSAHIPGSVLHGSQLTVWEGELQIDGTVHKQSKVINWDGNIIIDGRLVGGLLIKNGVAYVESDMSGTANISGGKDRISRFMGCIQEGARIDSENSDLEIRGPVFGGEIVGREGSITIDTDVMDGGTVCLRESEEPRKNRPLIIKGSIKGGTVQSDTIIHIKGDIHRGSYVNGRHGVICDGTIHEGAEVISDGVEIHSFDDSALSYRDRCAKEERKRHPELSLEDSKSRVSIETVIKLLRAGVTAEDLSQPYHYPLIMLSMFNRDELPKLFQPELWKGRPQEMERAWQLVLDMGISDWVPDYHKNYRAVVHEAARERFGSPSGYRGMGL